MENERGTLIDAPTQTNDLPVDETNHEAGFWSVKTVMRVEAEMENSFCASVLEVRYDNDIDAGG